LEKGWLVKKIKGVIKGRAIAAQHETIESLRPGDLVKPGVPSGLPGHGGFDAPGAVCRSDGSEGDLQPCWYWVGPS